MCTLSDAYRLPGNARLSFGRTLPSGNTSLKAGGQAQYRALASCEKNVIFGGRLAEYKYYDMAPIVKKVLNMFKTKAYER